MFELDSTSKGNLKQFANHSIILQYHDFGEDIIYMVARRYISLQVSPFNPFPPVSANWHL